MQSLSGMDPATTRAKRHGLKPAPQHIVELKAKHLALNYNEIAKSYT